MVSKPADCIFPYDFKDAVRKKVKFSFPFLCMSPLLVRNRIKSVGMKHVAYIQLALDSSIKIKIKCI